MAIFVTVQMPTVTLMCTGCVSTIYYIVCGSYISYQNVPAIGASSNICSETFAGPHAFSEPESRALADFVTSFSGQIKIYLAFHSYSQLVLFPWGHTDELADDYNVLVFLLSYYMLS